MGGDVLLVAPRIVCDHELGIYTGRLLSTSYNGPISIVHEERLFPGIPLKSRLLDMAFADVLTKYVVCNISHLCQRNILVSTFSVRGGGPAFMGSTVDLCPFDDATIQDQNYRLDDKICASVYHFRHGRGSILITTFDLVNAMADNDPVAEHALIGMYEYLRNWRTTRKGVTKHQKKELCFKKNHSSYEFAPISDNAFIWKQRIRATLPAGCRPGGRLRHT